MLTRTFQLAASKQWEELYKHRFDIETNLLLNQMPSERDRVATNQLTTRLENYELIKTTMSLVALAKSPSHSGQFSSLSFRTKLNDVCLAAMLDAYILFNCYDEKEQS